MAVAVDVVELGACDGAGFDAVGVVAEVEIVGVVAEVEVDMVGVIFGDDEDTGDFPCGGIVW